MAKIPFVQMLIPRHMQVSDASGAVAAVIGAVEAEHDIVTSLIESAPVFQGPGSASEDSLNAQLLDAGLGDFTSLSVSQKRSILANCGSLRTVKGTLPAFKRVCACCGFDVSLIELWSTFDIPDVDVTSFNNDQYLSATPDIPVIVGGSVNPAYLDKLASARVGTLIGGLNVGDSSVVMYTVPGFSDLLWKFDNMGFVSLTHVSTSGSISTYSMSRPAAQKLAAGSSVSGSPASRVYASSVVDIVLGPSNQDIVGFELILPLVKQFLPSRVSVRRILI